MQKLNDTDRASVAQSVKHAKLIEASRKLARIIRHTDPSATDKAKRTKLEKSLESWMRFHGGEAFSSPFSADHKKAIAKIETAVNSGGLFALAMPRGHGKSTILKWATIYVLLTGRRKYVVTVAATAELSQAVVEFVRQQIQESDTLHAHYPHVTTYARATDGKAIKARFQLRADGKTSGIQWSKTTLVLPEVLGSDGKPYASNGAILEGHGLTGAIRGKWKDSKTGKVLRPDFVLLDDPQSRESAESDSQCLMRERIITGDVLGLAGPRKKIAAVMPCTIIRKGDLASRFLDHKAHPEWQGETCSLVTKWPDSQDKLWADYAQIYRDETAEGRGSKKASEFYVEHRAEMDAGAVVSWEHRIRDGEISALQTAENLLIESGEQFYAEYQNDPHDPFAAASVKATPEIIIRRAIGPARGVAPEGAVHILAGADINPGVTGRLGARITWAAAAFQMHQSECVIAYGIHKLNMPTDPTPSQQVSTVYDGLNTIRMMLGGMGVELLIYDARGWMNHGVTRGQALRYGRMRFPSSQCAAMPAEGWSHDQYRPTHATAIKQFESCHLAQAVVEQETMRWIAWDADWFNLQVINAWLAAPGAPGACILHSGHHDGEFLGQITTRAFIGMVKKHSGQVYDWSRTVGFDDYGDCLAMCRVGAAFSGIGTGGARVKTATKCNVVISRPSHRR